MANWLPTLLNQRLPLREALHGTALFQLGGIVGALVFALAIKRWGAFGVLTASYLVTALALTLLGTSVPAVAWLFALVFVIGTGFVGGQSALNALAATMYPTAARSTGIGWAMGIGRKSPATTWSFQLAWRWVCSWKELRSYNTCGHRVGSRGRASRHRSPLTSG